ncbi:MAG: hypothetical protein NTX25_13510, partial [Proteobacteria bacterium]|nr:hypothetical protein [Pseudomonadota bacterium]
QEHFHLPSYANTDPNRYLQAAIHVAYKYWQDELAVGTRWLRSEEAPTVGTQDLEFGPCADDTDLRVQFGTLSKVQQKAFRDQGQDPRKFVSLAVRTDYDRIHLRGKGFLYVTADSGPLQPTQLTMMPQPWARGEARLIKVLAHELGHVFGLQHTASWGSHVNRIDLMESGFPASMVKDPADKVETPIPLFFSVNHTEVIQFSYDAESPYSAAVAGFLKLKAAPACLNFTRTDGKIEIFAEHDGCGDGEKTLLGSLNLDLSTMSISDFSPAISIWLPPEQTIFEPLSSEARKTLAVRTSFVQAAEYRDARSTMKRRMLVTIGPTLTNPIFGLSKAGDLIDLLFYTPSGETGGPVIKFAQ